MVKSFLALVKPRILVPHEGTSVERVEIIRKDIEDKGQVNPIIVDRRTNVVLDGAHRTAALILLHKRWAVVRYVDFMDPAFTMEMRRPELTIDKFDVLDVADHGNTYPFKTTMIFVREKGKKLRLNDAGWEDEI